MLAYDQHMHSEFSFDSVEPIEEYLKITENPIVTTEHLDFENPASGYRDDIPDYDGYKNKIKQLNARHGERVFSGIEIGYARSAESRIRQYLEGKSYDVRLLSVHNAEGKDFMQEKFYDGNIRARIEEYYSCLTEALESPVEAEVLTHFDYGIRLAKATVKDLERYGEKYLKKVIDLTIQKEMAIEINTRSMYAYGNAKLYDYFTELYLAAGGRLFSIGSDAHQVKGYQFEFEKAICMLLKKGVSEVAIFQGGRRWMRELEP